MKKIVLMTANTGGGIIQFTVQLYHTFLELGFSAKVCAPDSAKDTAVKEVPEGDRLLYRKIKSVVDKTPYRTLAKRIEAEHPDYILYCDDSVICSEVGVKIKNRGIRQLLTMHDAGGYHPTNHMSLRTRLLRKYVKYINRSFYKRVHKFVLLSSESLSVFQRNFPRYADHTLCMNLGAHIPAEVEICPPELAGRQGEYLLFFGRIDKYKGIEHLLRAYRPVEDQCLPLVIAGSGALSETEKKEAAQCENVLLLNRYIGDGEMKYLFSHSRAVVLPYIEATQSGVIPIAYSYGKPVVVSDLPGLVQFVEKDETGMICKTDGEWTGALLAMSEGVFGDRSDKILAYYTEHMDWNTNVERMFSAL